jgi:hypothetical protein
MNGKPDAIFAFFRVVGEAFFLYGLLGWTYGVLIQITNQDLLPTGLSHLTSWISGHVCSLIFHYKHFGLLHLEADEGDSRTTLNLAYGSWQQFGPFLPHWASLLLACSYLRLNESL